MNKIFLCGLEKRLENCRLRQEYHQNEMYRIYQIYCSRIKKKKLQKIFETVAELISEWKLLILKAA